MKNGSAVLIGGFSGGILRAALGLVVVTPIATLLVNLVGAFLLSFWTYWGIERGASPSWASVALAVCFMVTTIRNTSFLKNQRDPL